MLRVLLLAGAPLALAACGGGSSGEVAAANDTAENAAANAVVSAAKAPTPAPEKTAEERFADTAAAGDAYEIAAGNLAQQKGGSAAVKAFGKTLATDHGQTTAKLKLAASRLDGGLFIDPSLSDQQRADLAELEKLEGAAFDAAFKRQQVAAHQRMLRMYDAYRTSGGPEPLTTFAAWGTRDLRAHLTRAQGL